MRPANLAGVGRTQSAICTTRHNPLCSKAKEVISTADERRLTQIHRAASKTVGKALNLAAGLAQFLGQGVFVDLLQKPGPGRVYNR